MFGHTGSVTVNPFSTEKVTQFGSKAFSGLQDGNEGRLGIHE